MNSLTTDVEVAVVMPQLGVSVSEGTIVAWHKRAGDTVAADEPLVDVSTDKIDTEVPCPASGVLLEILAAAGDTVTVGTVIARLGGATEAAGDATSVGPSPARTNETTDASAADDRARRPVEDAGPPPSRYSPVVRRMAVHHGIDLTAVAGTGRNGRVRKQDVLAYLDQQSEPALHIESPYRPEPPSRRASDVDDVPPGREPGREYVPPAAEPLSRIRRSIAEHMKRSLDLAATCTTWIDVDFSAVERARRSAELTALPIVAAATVETLRAFPALNAWISDAGLILHPQVNLGIAVAVDDGLLVPVVHAADELSVHGLARRIRDLATRARSRELSADDMHAATFTITNPGQFGSIMATPIISQPQVAILDIEAIVRRPVVVGDGDGREAIAIRPMCTLGMSWDHRALDGAVAARFLSDLKRRLETIARPDEPVR